MKTKLYLLACLVCFSLTATAYSGPTILLHHKGKITVYETNILKEALDTAVDGDTVYLTKGVFYSGNDNNEKLVINKSIILKGASGEESYIMSAIGIVSREDLEADKYRVKIEGIGIEADWSDRYEALSVNTSNVTLRNCRINYNCVFGDFSENQISNIEIDNCKIGYFYNWNYKGGVVLYKNLKDIRFNHSVIYYVDFNGYEGSDWIGEKTNGQFVNCYIACYWQTLPSSFSFINCIFWEAYSNAMPTLPTYQYCLGKFSHSWKYNHKEKCYSTINENNEETVPLRVQIGDEVIEKWWDVNFLTENGFLGNDGTIVGPMGGKHPFTLEPELPVVTESSTKLDLANKKFNVNLTVSPKP